MPELPDVEVFRRCVARTSLHRHIDGVFLRARLVAGVAPQTLRERLRDAELTGVRRHGKHLFLRSSGGGWLRLHFGMTGSLDAGSGPAPEGTELRLDLAGGGHLAYVSRRRLGTISWVDAVEAFVEDRGLGPDPLADRLGCSAFAELVGSRHGTVKGTLMNQAVVAGLGNVYTDEILFQAGIHPASAPHALTGGQLGRLFDAMAGVIEGAVAHRADPGRLPADWLLPNRQAGVGCPRCPGRLERAGIAGRTTYLCPRHQDRIG